MKKILSDLPEVYKRFLPEFFSQTIPEESFATCDNCAMVCDPPPDAPLVSFLPDIKCCSYYPGLPNYLIGSLFADPNPALEEGKARVRQIIRQKRGVTPVGIQPPMKYSLFFTTTTNGFGQSHALLCPYYHRENGNCTIWKHREAVCTTFFCKPVAGSAGKFFWGAMKQYLLALQQELCNYVLLETGFENVYEIVASFNFSPGRTSQISVADLQEQAPEPEVYQRYWQQWHGREEEFYQTAYRLVSQLSPPELEAIMGSKQRTLLQNLAAKWSDMVELPERLVKHPDLRQDGNGHYLIQYNNIDVAFTLPSKVLDLFDGQHTYADAQQALNEQHGIEIDKSFIISLHKNNVLVASDTAVL